MSRAALPTIALSVAIGAMTACAPTQQPGTGPVLSSQPGQLFCHIQLAGGGSVLAAIVDATATAAAPAAGPLVVVATGQTKAFVDDACTKAAQQTAGAVSGEPRFAADTGFASSTGFDRRSAEPDHAAGTSSLGGAAWTSDRC
jgi:hypothetical protein